MKDSNICGYCHLYIPFDQHVCPNCHQVLVFDAPRGVAIWRLGEIAGGVLGHIARHLATAFGIPAVIQPAFLDERPSRRPAWCGISSNVFLAQIHRRHQIAGFVTIGITEKNIVPDARHNFLFGYAYLGFPAAVICLHAMRQDEPSTELLIKRASDIAVHEIGHTLGLDHHDYDEGIECVMVGDDEIDSLETIDEGSSRFCETCAPVVAKAFAKRAAKRA